MKELKRPISKELPPTRMYLDDVQAIYNILKNNCSSVRIETDKYEISDIVKLKDISVNEIHTISFKCRDPYIIIDLLPHGGRLYIEEDSTINRGILSQIEDILSKCERKIIRLLNSLPAYLVVGMLLGVAFPIIFKFTERWLSVTLSISLLVILILLLVKSYRLSLRQHSTIILSERRARASFIKRNKDQIIVGLIIATVSVALTVLAFKLFQWS